jgi:hypothetical protein
MADLNHMPQPGSDAFPDYVRAEAVRWIRAAPPDKRIGPLAHLVEEGGADVSLAYEAEGLLRSREGSDSFEHRMRIDQVARAYALRGYIPEAQRVVQLAGDANAVRIAETTAFWLHARYMPAWPEQYWAQGLAIAERADTMRGYVLARRLAQLQPARAADALDIAIRKSEGWGLHPQAHRLLEIVGVAARASRVNAELLPYARQVAEQITDDAEQLRARIAIVEAEPSRAPVRSLRKLKAEAQRKLADTNPTGLAEFMVTLRASERGPKVVSADEELAAIANIPDPYERAEYLGRAAARRKDTALLQRALATAEQTDDGRCMLLRQISGRFGAAGSHIAKPYILRNAPYETETFSRDMGLEQLAVLLVRSDTPDEARDIPALIQDEDVGVRAASAVVRGIAMQGRHRYGDAEVLATHASAADPYNTDALAAALVMGSARYRDPQDLRRAMTRVDQSVTRSEAWCEIALTTKDAQYLPDAVAASQERAVSAPSVAIEGLVHIIQTHAVLRGKPVQIRPGLGWSGAIHRWAFPEPVELY